MWRDRLHPSSALPVAGPEPWWSVTDEVTARRAADDAVAQLESHGVPLLRRLLHRDELISTVEAGDLGHFKSPDNTTRFDSILVVLLTDECRTDEAATALARIGAREDEASQIAFQRLGNWLAE
jgi:hypothetical protein